MNQKDNSRELKNLVLKMESKINFVNQTDKKLKTIVKEEVIKNIVKTTLYQNITL